jgi:outer membrane protein OmpA-like peptidoglycan-associated protein
MGLIGQISSRDERAAEREGERDRRAPLPPEEDEHPLLALQRDAGNRAVSRMIADGAYLLRQPAGPVAPPAPAGGDVAGFMAKSYSKQNIHPSTGRGLFDASYEPSTGAMTITVRVAFNFKTGNILDPDWLAKVGGFPGLLASGWTASDFIWTEDEKTKWAENAIREVQNLWSEQYVFYSTTAGWEALPPVHVNVVIQQGEPDKSQWVIDVNKWPTDAGLDESMDVPGAGSTQSHGRLQESTRDAGGITEPDNEHRRRSTGARTRYGQVDTDNPGIVFFDQGSSTVSPSDVAALQTFGATLGAPDIPPFPVVLTGHASSEGEETRNMRLSEDRARNVANEIVKAGAKKQPTEVPKGEQGATEDPTWRMVEIDVKDFEGDQTTVKHEFGHILGLGDEYPTADGATSRPVGTPVAHSALAQRLIPGQQPIVAHHDESIMSNGEEVRPYHYVTFLEALGTLTGVTTGWDIRPGPGPGAHGPGDFPPLTPPGTAAA